MVAKKKAVRKASRKHTAKKAHKKHSHRKHAKKAAKRPAGPAPTMITDLLEAVTFLNKILSDSLLINGSSIKTNSVKLNHI
jgi:hypothetical protein